MSLVPVLFEGWRGPGSRRMVLRGSVAALLLLAMGTTVGCDDGRESAPPTEDGGPLRQLTGAGGFTAYAQQGSDWHTFGGFRLCLTDPGQDARIISVQLELRGRGAEAQVYTRQYRQVVDDEAGEVATLITSEAGRPPDLQGPPAPGSFEEFGGPLTGPGAAGGDFAVTLACDSRDGFDELMIALNRAQGDVRVSGFEVTYQADGESFVQRVPWTMYACSQTSAARRCDT